MIIPEELAIHPPKKHLLKIINEKSFSDKILYKKQSAFHNIKVTENEIGRFLHYNNTYQAGFINTSYYKGNLPYINYFLLPYFIKSSVNTVLLIGLGSGQIINDYFKIFPNIKRFDIVDIEENIFDIAKKYFDFTPNERVNFYLQDALIYLRTTKKKYDIIIVDVANNDGIDERFVSEDYLSCIKNRLRKKGIFISNLCSSADLYNSENKFFNHIRNLYSSKFKYIKYFKGNYSDKIYYKCFFDINERVIDITNLIILSSEEKFNINNSRLENFTSIFPNIDISSILNDEV